MPKLRFVIENKSFYPQELLYRKISSFTLEDKIYNRIDYNNQNIMDFYWLIKRNVSKITLIKYYHKIYTSYKDNESIIVEASYYLKNMKLHNLSGPALIYNNDSYYINGEYLDYKDWLNHPLRRKDKLKKLLAEK